jgi:hypothetical protein
LSPKRRFEQNAVVGSTSTSSPFNSRSPDHGIVSFWAKKRRRAKSDWNPDTLHCRHVWGTERFKYLQNESFFQAWCVLSIEGKSFHQDNLVAMNKNAESGDSTAEDRKLASNQENA